MNEGKCLQIDYETIECKCLDGFLGKMCEFSKKEFGEFKNKTDKELNAIDPNMKVNSTSFIVLESFDLVFKSDSDSLDPEIKHKAYGVSQSIAEATLKGEMVPSASSFKVMDVAFMVAK